MILYFPMCTGFTADPNIKWDVLPALRICTGRYRQLQLCNSSSAACAVTRAVFRMATALMANGMPQPHRQRIAQLATQLGRGGDGGGPPAAAPASGATPAVSVTFTGDAAGVGLDGRLLLLIAKQAEPEPRLNIGFMNALQDVQMFGLDVDGWAAGAPQVFAAATIGFPLHSLADVEPGEYYAQAVLSKYETFNLSTGHTVKLPPGDGGDGQKFARAPGNLYCAPVGTATADTQQAQALPLVSAASALPVRPVFQQERRDGDIALTVAALAQVAITLGPGSAVELVMDLVMPPIVPAEDTEW